MFRYRDLSDASAYEIINSPDPKSLFGFAIGTTDDNFVIISAPNASPSVAGGARNSGAVHIYQL